MKEDNSKKYDLEERTAKFGEEVIIFIKTIPDNTINHILIVQSVKSVTSIGANYCEANGAESKRDFKHKIGICKKEAKETEHWLRMLAVANPDKVSECRKLWKEAHELVLIFSQIILSSSGN